VANIDPPAARPASPPVSASSLLAETTALDEARAAARSKDFRRALRVLDGYGATFPDGALAPEANVLRIEVKLGLGDASGARRLAEAFLRDHADSPLAARVRGLVASIP
jgi:TolA-binding protein